MTPPLTILRSQHRQIIRDHLTSDVIDALPRITKSIEICAAKLLGILERLTLWKQTEYKKFTDNCWFWIPIFKRDPTPLRQQDLFEADVKPLPFRSLYDELQGEHCSDVIRAGLNLLRQIGFLERKHNPYNAQDRTWWYRIDLEKLSGSLSGIQGANGGKTGRKPGQGAMRGIPAWKNDIPALENEISAMIYSEINPDPSDLIVEEREIAIASKYLENLEQSKLPSPLERESPPSVCEVGPEDSDGGEIFPALAQESEMLKRLAALGIEANSTIEKYLKRFRSSGDRIQNAISFVAQQVAKGGIQSASALLVAAIKEGRKPKAAPLAASYPPGDWLDEAGQLDAAFVLHLAKVWRTGDVGKSLNFAKMTIEAVETCVRAHFLNHPEKVQIAWRSYGLESRRYVENVSLRLDSGADISLNEQSKLLGLLPVLQSVESNPQPFLLSTAPIALSVVRELERLNWTQEQAILHMVETFGWRKIAFDRLTEEDLFTLLIEIEQLEQEGHLD